MPDRRYQRDHTFAWTHGERLRHIYAEHSKDLELALQHMSVAPNLADESVYLVNRTRSLHQSFHGTPRNSVAARKAAQWKRMTGLLDTPTRRPKPRPAEDAEKSDGSGGTAS